MANWAKLQEDLTGLKVVKRAKHGIHFDKGGGEVLANFSGKPCHFLDGGLWKPIDTKLLLRKDGTYGCAHSDVIIHTDGTVQVGDYTQKAALIYPGKISVDGDRIARPFSGGVQYLYITEDGFRQEIVLDKKPDLRKVSALVDSVKGVLPTKYTASSLSLKDSSTAELSDFVQVDSKSLASVLEAAKYPVVIDPDFAVPTNGDGTLRASYPYRLYRNTFYTLAASLTYSNLFRFDLSSIDGSATCTAATMYMYKYDAAGTARNTTFPLYVISAANGDWESGAAGNPVGAGLICWGGKESDGAGGITTAWAGSAGLQTSGTDYDATQIGDMPIANDGDAGDEFSCSLTTAKVQAWFGAASNPGMTFWNSTATTYYNGWCSSLHTTAGYRPKLTVTYTAGGAHLKVNMNAQMQNLSGNMRG